MRRLAAVLLAFGIVLSMTILPAGAADNNDSSAQISARIKALEKKYGIWITYPMDVDGEIPITLNNLETLDKAFSTVTPSAVRQISESYEEANGKRLTVSYMFSEESIHYAGGVLLAAFETTSSNIYVFLPSVSGYVIVSGENPIALVHELGHAFHLMTMEKYGEDKMRSEWSKFNGKNQYRSNNGFTNPDENVFITGYAASSFEEDFAETFAHVFVRNHPGLGFKDRLSSEAGKTGLGRKVDYIARMIKKYLDGSDGTLFNYNKIHDTPVTLSFEGALFSGSHLQYINYPHPKYILSTLLSELKITSEKTTWVRNIGAWRVIDQSGDEYFLFPGGAWRATGRNAEIAA